MRFPPRLAATNFVPAGSRSQTLTLCSGHGLGLETFGMNVAVPPAGIVDGLALSRSRIRLCGPGVILVVAVARVRDVGVSGVGVATSAELTSLPTDSARAIRVIVAWLPGTRWTRRGSGSQGLLTAALWFQSCDRASFSPLVWSQQIGRGQVSDGVFSTSVCVVFVVVAVALSVWWFGGRQSVQLRVAATGRSGVRPSTLSLVASRVTRRWSARWSIAVASRAASPPTTPGVRRR